MEVLGFSSTSPAGTILQYLQRNGQASIKELEDVLGVSTTAVREHLAHLHAEGLISTSTVRRGPGRPHFVYSLTNKAQNLFPKHYDLLINLLLHEIAAEEGREKVDKLLERVSNRLAKEYADRMNGEDVQARLVELRSMLESRGIPAEIHQSGDGLQIFSCPYFDVAQEHAEVCTMERQMLEQLLGEKITLKDSIRDGHHHCSFFVNNEQP